MKLFATTALLASLASTAFGGPLEDFGLGDGATITYDNQSNIFSLNFVGGTESGPDKNSFDYTFYQFDCEAQLGDGEGVNEGFENSVFGNGGGTAEPKMTFLLNMSKVKGSTEAFFPEADGSKAEIRMCVRNTVLTDDGSIEVNFQESQITLLMDLTANVITSTTVAKRDKNAETAAEQVYTIDCTICGDTPTPVRQGDLVTVCMEPDSTDVVIASLTSFDWTQVGTEAEQPAVINDAPANALSSAPDCATKLPTKGSNCGFSSVLFAGFYVTPNTVDGGGSATFALNRRRLNAGNNDEVESRLLQGLEGDVNVAVPLDNSDTGPGALKTAGGASFGTALASGVALLSAALLA